MFALLRTLLTVALLWLVLNLGYCQAGWQQRPGHTGQLAVNAGLCWPQRLANSKGPIEWLDTLWKVGLGQGPDWLMARFGLGTNPQHPLVQVDCARLDRDGATLFGIPLPRWPQANQGEAPKPEAWLKQWSPKGGEPADSAEATMAPATPKPVSQRGSL
jgi:hypothetical protein